MKLLIITLIFLISIPSFASELAGIETAKVTEKQIENLCQIIKRNSADDMHLFLFKLEGNALAFYQNYKSFKCTNSEGIEKAPLIYAIDQNSLEVFEKMVNALDLSMFGIYESYAIINHAHKYLDSKAQTLSNFFSVITKLSKDDKE